MMACPLRDQGGRSPKDYIRLQVGGGKPIDYIGLHGGSSWLNHNIDKGSIFFIVSINFLELKYK